MQGEVTAQDIPVTRVRPRGSLEGKLTSYSTFVAVGIAGAASSAGDTHAPVPFPATPPTAAVSLFTALSTDATAADGRADCSDRASGSWRGLLGGSGAGAAPAAAPVSALAVGFGSSACFAVAPTVCTTAAVAPETGADGEGRDSAERSPAADATTPMGQCAVDSAVWLNSEGSRQG